MKTEHVTYLRPPTPKASRKKKPKTAWQEITSFAFRYRVQLIPFMITLMVLTASLALGRVVRGGVPVGTVALVLAHLALAWGLYQDRWHVPARVPWIRLDRPLEHWYAASCATVPAVWYVYAAWGAKPSPRAVLVLVLLTCLCATPWWWHRRVRGSIPCHFQGLAQKQRQVYLAQARALISDWTAFTSAGQAQGAKLIAMSFNPWSVSLVVKLRRGATVREFTVNRLAKLESAFGDVKAGSARVESVGRSSQRALFRFMINDPHEYPISPPSNSYTTFERIVFGLFETGEEVLFTLVNTLIGGATGAGKSGVVNMVIHALARIPTVAIIGIDLKPGAPELGKWEKVMHALAKTPEEGHVLLDQLMAGLKHRGDTMSANKWRKWHISRSEPFIVLIVDEIQEARKARLMKKIEDITAIIRAYGGCVVVATQYPTTPNVSAAIKSNCPQRIGLRMDDPVGDRVIFGEGATRTGWRPSTIDTAREGSLFVRSPLYKKPILARSYWLTDDEIDAEADKWADQRTAIDTQMWVAKPIESGTTAVVNLDKGSDSDVDIVDAIIVDDDPAERILRALERGRTSVRDICADAQVSSATAYRKLHDLEAQGLVASPARGVWASEREKIVSQ